MVSPWNFDRMAWVKIHRLLDCASMARELPRERRSSTLSWGIQLLGFTQRQIRVSRSHIPTYRNPRKLFPTTLKTPGDHIKAKRFEKGLLQSELAEKLGVSVRLVKL
jgi:ribosome-binding protein aMBF1 (putative translation factor)